MNTTQITDLYASDPKTRIVLDHFTHRRRERQELSVAQLHHLTSAPYEDIIHTLRRLEDLGLGTFTGGPKARFRWKDRVMLVVAGAIKSAVESPTLAPEPEKEGATVEVSDRLEKEHMRHMTLDHTYHLREDYTVDIELPRDLTPVEAKRLADYILTLPIEH